MESSMSTVMPDIEGRVPVSPIEIREVESGAATIAGYAAVFGDSADIGGYFREVVARGAFTNTLKTSDVRAYFGHDRNRILGRVSAGTLRVREDEKGLLVEIDLPDTSDGRDAKVSIERGDISGMSFGFSAVRQSWDETSDPATRTLKEVILYEVSITADPAYTGTSIALRSRDEARKDRRRHNFSGAARRVHLDLRARGVAVESKA
jgi:HK97 family phage prohead protease